MIFQIAIIHHDFGRFEPMFFRPSGKWVELVASIKRFSKVGHARGGYTCCRSLYVLDCHCTSFSSTTGGGRSTSRTVAPECRSCRVGRHRCSSPPRDSTAQTPSPGAVLPSSRSWLPPRRNAATPGRRRQAELSCALRLEAAAHWAGACGVGNPLRGGGPP